MLSILLFDKVVQSLETTGLLQEDEKGRKVVEGENAKWFEILNEFGMKRLEVEKFNDFYPEQLVVNLVN